MFDKTNVFYFKDPRTIFDDTWLLDQQKISALKHHALVIADFSREHFGPNGLACIYETLEYHGINFILLTHDPREHQSLPKMFFYPYWYNYAKLQFKKIDCRTKRKYFLGCLNGSPRPHRIANYFGLQKHIDFAKSYISIYSADQLPTREDDIEINDQERHMWYQTCKNFPKFPGVFDNIYPDASLNSPALTDAYIHLTTETTVIDRIFLSEKTWKPIAAGQLFLQFGNPGTVKFLRSCGVDTYDDIIDHDSYDHIQDWRQRMDRIHFIIRDLVDRNIEDIWNSTQYRREANRKNFFSGKFSLPYRNDFIDNFLKDYVLLR